MKKLLLTISFLFLSPFSAFAISVSPSSTFLDYPNPLGLISDVSPTSYCYLFSLDDPTNLSATLGNCGNGSTYAIAEGNPIQYADVPTPPYNFIIVNFSLPSVCSDDVDIDTCRADPNYISETSFNILSDSEPPPLRSGILFGRSGESQQAIQSGGSSLSAVGLVSTDVFSSLFSYLILPIGIFIGFYIIQQLIMVVGDKMNPEKVKIDPEKGRWTAKGLAEKEYRQWRKKARSRKKRGLDIE